MKRGSSTHRTASSTSERVADQHPAVHMFWSQSHSLLLLVCLRGVFLLQVIVCAAKRALVTEAACLVCAHIQQQKGQKEQPFVDAPFSEGTQGIACKHTCFRCGKSLLPHGGEGLEVTDTALHTSTQKVLLPMRMRLLCFFWSLPSFFASEDRSEVGQS